MYNRLILSLGFLLFITSLFQCSTPQVENKERVLEGESFFSSFQKADSDISPFLKYQVELLLDDYSSTKSPCIQYLEEQGQLALMNVSINSIDFYAIHTGKMVKRIKLAEEGPNGVGKVRMFGIHDSTLFVLNDEQMRLYLVNSSGKVKMRYNLAGSNAPKPRVRTMEPMTIIPPLVYMNSTPSRNFASKNFCEAEDLVTILNLDTGEIKYTLGYPEEMKMKLWGPNLAMKYHAYNPDTKKFIYAFAASHYVIETDFTEKNHYLTKSKYITDIPPAKKVSNDFNQRHKIYTDNPEYTEIFYDKYRKRIYRVANQPIPEHLKDSDDFDESMIKPFSIIVLDEKFNMLGEFKFPHLKYYSYMGFVKEEGFCMARFPESEDRIIFDCFDFPTNEN
jgi:hypothetical protein